MAPEAELITPGMLAAQISQSIVRIWHEYTGRGPTKARTTITEDLIVVLMSDTLLKAERNLAHDGKEDQVLAMRRAFQDTMRADLTAAVEGLTGRTVLAFMSHNNVDPDLAAELFVLEPRHDGDGRRTADAARTEAGAGRTAGAGRGSNDR